MSMRTREDQRRRRGRKRKRDAEREAEPEEEREVPPMRLLTSEELPERELPDLIDAYLAANENSEPPTSYHLWTCISCIAAAMQRKCSLQWFTLRVYPNLFTALVGPPGATRKGTALSLGIELLNVAGIRRCADTTTRESFIEELEAAKQLYIDEQGEIQQHCSITALSPELTVLLGYKNNKFMDDLTDLFDCRESFDYKTKRSGKNLIRNVWLNLLGATTQHSLRECLPDNAFGGGFLSRFIVICETQKRHSVAFPQRSDDEEAVWQAVRRDYPKLLQLHGEFIPTAEYYSAYERWYADADSNPPFRDPKLDAYTSRRSLHLWKLSMISSASRGNDRELTAYDFDRAVTWLSNAELRMPQAFTLIGKHQLQEVTQQIMSFVALRHEVTVGEIMRTHYRDIDADMLERILTTLETMNFCRYTRSSNFSRSTVSYTPQELGGT